MTHEYDDPVTNEIIDLAVRLTIESRQRNDATPLRDLAAAAVDQAFCTCVTGAADASVNGRSPTHAGLIAEVARRAGLQGGAG